MQTEKIEALTMPADAGQRRKKEMVAQFPPY